MEVRQILKTWRIFAATVVAELMGGLIVRSGFYQIITTLTYATSIAIDASLGNAFVVSITDGVAFAIAAPTNPPATGYAQVITITFRNTSGGAAGAGTFNAIYKMVSNTLAVIATGTSRTYAFQWNGTNWVQLWQTAADVAN